MALTVCHTGDWHLGHTLYRRSREHEHTAFLAWLLDELVARETDALIVAGDVFDSGSPSGSGQAMFYGFLAEARRRLPELTVVVVAGNHDSPARLAAPDVLLRDRGVSLIGSVLDAEGRVDVERLVVPLRRGGRVEAVVAAVPFLRGADVPAPPEGEPWSEDAHVRGCRRVYDEALAHACAVACGAPVIATGHFAAAGAQMSRESERLLAVGVDGTLPVDVVDLARADYLALGHLHMAQLVRRRPRGEARATPARPFRSRSPSAASSTRCARSAHARGRAERGARIPRAIELRRLPDEGLLAPDAAIAALGAFAARDGAHDEAAWPWVEVRVTARAGERGVVERIEEAAGTRALHLTRVVVEVPDEERERQMREATALASLDVRDVLAARWQAEHGVPPSSALLEALDEATREARARLEAREPRSVEVEAERAWVRALPRAARRREAED